MRKVVNTNQHIKNAEDREEAIIRFVIQSSAIEDIKVEASDLKESKKPHPKSA